MDPPVLLIVDAKSLAAPLPDARSVASPGLVTDHGAASDFEALGGAQLPESDHVYAPLEPR